MQYAVQPVYKDDEIALYGEMFASLSKHVWPRACKEFKRSLPMLPISRDTIPALEDVSDALRKLTGWKIVGVPGIVGERDLIECYAHKEVPVCVKMRPRIYKKHSPAPDIVHDLLGHSVLFADPTFALIAEAYGRQGMLAIRNGLVTPCDRVFFRLETGLVLEDGAFRLLGPATLTSLDEAKKALGRTTPRKLFDVAAAMRVPVDDAHVQQVYYYTRSLAELLDLFESDWEPFYEKIAA